MTPTRNNLSAFNWRGPSQVVNKMGRIKTERQLLLDATRAPESNLGYATAPTKSEKAPR